MKKLILQIQIPFCYRRCSYCQVPICKYDEKVISAYVQAVLREIEAASEDMDEYEVSAISIEGGSPVLATPGGLQEILRRVKKHFQIASDVQIALQTMPGEYSRALLQKMRDQGVNHWIVGLQTTAPAEHELLERPYRFDALTMVDAALRNFQMRDCSFELLYGIPGQTMKSWKNTLEKALYYTPEHMTLYPLRLAKGTKLQQRCVLGEIKPCGSEETAAFYDYARERLEQLGYHAYTICDFAKPGKENRFRLEQLNGTEQLGIGYGAVSLLDGVSYRNGHSLSEYLEHSEDLSILADHLVRLDEEGMKKLAESRRRYLGNNH